MKLKAAPFRSGASERRLKAALLIILMLGLNSGCTLVKGVLELPDKALRTVLFLNEKGEAVDPVELQSKLIRFSDHYLDAVNANIGKLKEEGQTLERRVSLLRYIALTDVVLSIATGSNAYANLLDMLILVSLNRMNVEDYWMPKRFGETARPLLQTSQEAEKEIWRIAEMVLKKSQIGELRDDIRAWHEQHPDGITPRDVGSLGFASEIERMNRTANRESTSVFNLLMIDPLSGLDPATRELANTRLAAERGLFLARRLPTLLRWEAELLAIKAAEIPQMEKMLASADRLSESADRFSKLSEGFPTLISGEREHIVEALNSQRPGLISLAAKTEKAFGAGKLMSDAATATLKTYQDLVRQLEARAPNPNAEPFRISEYAETAARINSAAQQLVALLEAFNETASPERFDAISARMDMLNRQAQSSGKDLVDYAYRKTLILGSILIAVACSMALATVLIYWMLKRKLAGMSPKPGSGT